MIDREELMIEILKRVKRNYAHMAEVERLTKEMGEAISRNDRESIFLLMRMREDEMQKILKNREQIHFIVDSQEPAISQEVEVLFQTDCKQPQGFEERKIWELNRQMMGMKERTVALDKVISSKLAGTKSYYQNQ